jgi:hypothetical protein
VLLILIVLLLGVTGAAIFTANAGAPVGRSVLTPRVYLPLVARPVPTPGPGDWTIILEEEFEATPGPLWQFRDDNGAIGGAYQWGRRDCLPSTGSYSAWAVGGGTDGYGLVLQQRLPRQRRFVDDVWPVRPNRRQDGADTFPILSERSWDR